MPYGRIDLPRWRAPRIPRNITGLDIAKGISPSLASRTVRWRSMATGDLSDPIGEDAKIEFVSRDDPRALRVDPS